MTTTQPRTGRLEVRSIDYVPLNERQERKPEFLTYVVWDWFDGGLFQFWK